MFRHLWQPTVKWRVLWERYEREVWEYNLKLKQKEKPAKKPPEKQSVREHLRQLQEQGKQQSHKKKSFDRER